MTYSQKYTLVHFISPATDGVEFHMSDWPLHITLADVFAIDRSNLDTALADFLAQTAPVKTTALSNSTLGAASVILLDKSPTLLQLHADIVSLLGAHGVVFNNPEFTRDGFIPHSTIQKSSQLQVNDEVTIDSVSLIDMFPDNDWEQRRVLATFEMKK
jgi:hypothetical protein